MAFVDGVIVGDDWAWTQSFVEQSFVEFDVSVNQSSMFFGCVNIFVLLWSNA